MKAQGCYLATIRVDQRILERKLVRALAELDSRIRKTKRAADLARLKARRAALRDQIRAVRASMREAEKQTRAILRGSAGRSSRIC